MVWYIWWVHYSLSLRGASVPSVMEMLPLSFVQTLNFSDLRRHHLKWLQPSILALDAAVCGSQWTCKCFVMGQTQGFGILNAQLERTFSKTMGFKIKGGLVYFLYVDEYHMPCYIFSQRNCCLEKTEMDYKEINLIQEVLWTIKEIKQLFLAGDRVLNC